MKKFVLIMGALIILSLASASALIVNSVTVDNLSPGKEGTLRLEIKNSLSEDAQDVSFSLQLANTPFITLGGSEESVDEILSDDEETFAFQLRVSPTAKPGDYAIPYTLKYKVDGDKRDSTGTIGIKVGGQPALSYTISAATPVVGQKTKMTFKIVNNGLADAKFVSVKLLPQGYTLLSDADVYVGTVSSDDFESVSTDAVITNDNPKLSALVTYKDFENRDISESVSIPIIVYGRDKAIELGIISKSYTMFYVLGAVALIVIWFIWRIIRKSLRNRRASLKVE